MNARPVLAAAILVLTPLAGNAQEPSLVSDDDLSLVPPVAEIDDREVKLEMARTLANSPGGQPRALELYTDVLRSGAHRSMALVRERRDLAFRVGRLDLAAEDFATLEKTGRLGRDEALWYADILRRLGRRDEALALITRRMAGGDGSRDLVAIYVAGARAQGKLPEARQQLAALAARYPAGTNYALGAAMLFAEAGDSVEAAALLDRALVTHPNDAELLGRRADLALAAQELDAALALYKRAVTAAPARAGFRRQAARVAGYRNRLAEAEALLTPLLEPSVDEQFRRRLDAATLRALAKKRAQTPFSLYETAAARGKQLPASARRAVAELAETYQTQRGAWLELRAMRALADGRPAVAAQAYRELRDLEPSDLSSAYGLAGALAASGDPRAALAAYRELAATNPRDAFVLEAIQEIEDQFRDRVRAAYVFSSEDSPGRLADISRNVFTVTFETWINDHVRLALGPAFWIEQPAGVSSPYFATGGTALVEWRVNPRLSLALDYTSKNYVNADLQGTHTGGFTLTATPWDGALLIARLGREDVLHNAYNFTQRTQADLARVSFQTPVNRWLEVSGDVGLRRYTDDNLQAEAGAGVGIVIVRYPGKLVAEIKGRYLTTEKESVTEFANGRESNVIHPYWTPRNYARGAVGLTWEQSLKRRGSPAANDLSYRVGAQAGIDTDNNPSIALSASLRYEIVRNLILELSGNVERSPQWNGANAAVSLNYGF